MNALARRDAYFQEVTALRAQLDEALEELRQLKEAGAGDEYLPASWQLVERERRILLALHHAPDGYLRYGALCAEVFDAPDEDELLDPAGMVKVYVCHLRKKGARLGFLIETRWGQGYRLPPHSREVIACAIVTARGEEAAPADLHALLGGARDQALLGRVGPLIRPLRALLRHGAMSDSEVARWLAGQLFPPLGAALTCIP